MFGWIYCAVALFIGGLDGAAILTAAADSCTVRAAVVAPQYLQNFLSSLISDLQFGQIIFDTRFPENQLCNRLVQPSNPPRQLRVYAVERHNVIIIALVAFKHLALMIDKATHSIVVFINS